MEWTMSVAVSTNLSPIKQCTENHAAACDKSYMSAVPLVSLELTVLRAPELGGVVPRSWPRSW